VWLKDTNPKNITPVVSWHLLMQKEVGAVIVLRITSSGIVRLDYPSQFLERNR